MKIYGWFMKFMKIKLLYIFMSIKEERFNVGKQN